MITGSRMYQRAGDQVRDPDRDPGHQRQLGGRAGLLGGDLLEDADEDRNDEGDDDDHDHDRDQPKTTAGYIIADFT